MMIYKDILETWELELLRFSRPPLVVIITMIHLELE